MTILVKSDDVSRYTEFTISKNESNHAHISVIHTIQENKSVKNVGIEDRQKV